MPELPEVETIRQGLFKKIIGLEITSVEVLNPKTFQSDPTLILNSKIINVWRRGKVLGIDLDNKRSLLFHLKMSGQVLLNPSLPHPTKSTRVIFNLNDGSVIYFNDQRKFGWIKIYDQAQLDSDKFLSSLGPEPLAEEFNEHIQKLQLLKRKNQPVKVALLDQQVISGVGNIYACESCFLAGVDPRKRVKDLNDKEFKLLTEGVIISLKMGITHGGASKTHYINAEGGRGSFLDFAYVYGREGEPCKKCKTPIQKIKLAGRGTFFCPRCQKI